MMIGRQCIAVGDDVDACVYRTLSAFRSLDVALNFASALRRFRDGELDVSD